MKCVRIEFKHKDWLPDYIVVDLNENRVNRDAVNAPFYIDTMEIERVMLYSNPNGNFVIMHQSDGSLSMSKHSSLRINGTDIVFDGTVASATKIIDIVGEIMMLEHDMPDIDVEKFSKIGKETPKK